MIVVASNDHRFLVAENISEIDCQADILLEPVARNSCAAVISGCLQAAYRDPDAIVVVLAADHLVSDIDGFVRTIENAIPASEQGLLVTFGIRPTHAATGYGYLKVGQDLSSNGLSGCNVDEFIEKPDQESAEAYLKEGYFWNSGNFMFKAASFLKEAEHLASDVFDNVKQAFDMQVKDLDFSRLEPEAFARSPSISVDYAIMEKTKKAVMIPAKHDWSDIGTWHSVWDNLPKDDELNAVIGDVVLKDGKRNLVHSSEKLTTLIGVDDLVVVSTSDVVLVSNREQSERIRVLVETLNESGRMEATGSRKEYRPWGSYDVLDTGTGYKVKRIEIKPGGVLSLQRHSHRAEHWILVSGNLEITLEDSVQNLIPNQSVYVDRQVIHRLANRGEETAILIEVQTGDYLGEDDIERFEDEYNRTDQP